MSWRSVELVLVDPGPGQEVVFVADRDMAIESIAFQFITDANVANRFPVLVGDDGAGNVFFRSQISGAGQAASTTTRYAAFAGAPLNQTQHVQFALPPNGLKLRKGYRLRTITQNIQVGDDYSAPFALINDLPDA